MQALAPGMGAYFQAVLVFTSAWFRAEYGTTGKAHCVRDDRFRTYILNGKGQRRPSRAEVEGLATAFSGLAQMHPESAGEPARQEEGGRGG